jgi:hypothetical protein
MFVSVRVALVQVFLRVLLVFPDRSHPIIRHAHLYKEELNMKTRMLPNYFTVSGCPYSKTGFHFTYLKKWD